MRCNVIKRLNVKSGILQNIKVPTFDILADSESRLPASNPSAPVKEVLASESESRRPHGSRTAVAANVDPIGSSCSSSALAATCSVIGVTCRAIESRCSARFSPVSRVTRARLERGDIGVTGEFGSSCTQIVGVLTLEIYNYFNVEN